jgi:hypothetical protein
VPLACLRTHPPTKETGPHDVPWFPVDDTFHSHPKRLATSAAALGLWVVAGSWSNAHLTDGRVPDHVLPLLLPDAETLADELVRTGLWRRTRGGYAFKDWLEWGSKHSAAEVRDIRRKRAEAGRKGGVASGKARSKPEATSEANASRLVEPQALPSPSSGTGLFQGDRSRARARDPSPYPNGQVNPGEGAAARHPSARPLADAQRAAGLDPGHQPARGHTVASFADQIRQAINKPQENP